MSTERQDEFEHRGDVVRSWVREFKIFTNVLSSVVDPKHFDPKSFVEFEGDVCIVPPNSFAGVTLPKL